MINPEETTNNQYIKKGIGFAPAGKPMLPAWYNPDRRRSDQPGEALKREVCLETGITIVELEGSSRRRHIVQARQAFVYIIKNKHPDYSWPRIASMIGDRDHTTIMHAYRRAEEKLADDPEFADLLAKLGAV